MGLTLRKYVDHPGDARCSRAGARPPIREAIKPRFLQTYTMVSGKRRSFFLRKRAHRSFLDLDSHVLQANLDAAHAGEACQSDVTSMS